MRYLIGFELDVRRGFLGFGGGFPTIRSWTCTCEDSSDCGRLHDCQSGRAWTAEGRIAQTARRAVVEGAASKLRWAAHLCRGWVTTSFCRV